MGLFRRRSPKREKHLLPNPNHEYRLVFKKGAIATIKKAKGWKTDSEMARALGITRSYISMLRATRVSVTANVITRLAAQLGSTEGNWWSHFEIVPWGVQDINHPVWNVEKTMGRMAYSRFGSHGNRGDFNAEKQSLRETVMRGSVPVEIDRKTKKIKIKRKKKPVSESKYILR